MRNAGNFLLFQAVWFTTVWGAAGGRPWIGPIATLAFLGVHLRMLGSRRERRRELAYVLAVGLLGTVADSLLHAVGATAYPSSHQRSSGAWAPLWITSLWLAFATLPRFSLGWLRGRPVLAAALGAVGGPLAYLAGTRLGAVAVGDSPLLTWAALALEYAVATPLLLRFAAPESRVPGNPAAEACGAGGAS